MSSSSVESASESESEVVVGSDEESVASAEESADSADLVGVEALVPKTEAFSQWIWTRPWASAARVSSGQLL